MWDISVSRDISVVPKSPKCTLPLRLPECVSRFRAMTLSFPDGVVSDDCATGVRVTTHTKSTCDLRCADGYFGSVSLSCPEDAIFWYVVITITPPYKENPWT